MLHAILSTTTIPAPTLLTHTHLFGSRISSAPASPPDVPCVRSSPPGRFEFETKIEAADDPRDCLVRALGVSNGVSGGVGGGGGRGLGLRPASSLGSELM